MASDSPLGSSPFKVTQVLRCMRPQIYLYLSAQQVIHVYHFSDAPTRRWLSGSMAYVALPLSRSFRPDLSFFVGFSVSLPTPYALCVICPVSGVR